jgi:hypothetical protein
LFPFVALRITILRRPTLYYVGYVDRLARALNGGKDAVEEIPRPADKRPSLLVFVGSRALTDHHESRVRRTLSRHRVDSFLAQTTLLATANNLRKRVQVAIGQ